MTVTLTTSSNICDMTITNSSGLSYWMQYTNLNSSGDDIHMNYVSSSNTSATYSIGGNTSTYRLYMYACICRNGGSSGNAFIPALLIMPDTTNTNYLSVYNFEDNTRSRYYLYNNNTASYTLSDTYMSSSVTTTTSPFTTSSYTLSVPYTNNAASVDYVFTGATAISGTLSSSNSFTISQDSTLSLTGNGEGSVMLTLVAADSGEASNIVGTSRTNGSSFDALPASYSFSVSGGYNMSTLYVSGAEYKTITVDYENTTTPVVTDS